MPSDYRPVSNALHFKSFPPLFHTSLILFSNGSGVCGQKIEVNIQGLDQDTSYFWKGSKQHLLHLWTLWPACTSADSNNNETIIVLSWTPANFALILMEEPGLDSTEPFGPRWCLYQLFRPERKIFRDMTGKLLPGMYLSAIFLCKMNKGRHREQSQCQDQPAAFETDLGRGEERLEECGGGGVWPNNTEVWRVPR